jgi:hypothetical protein
MHRLLRLLVVILVTAATPALAAIYDVDRTDDSASATACTVAVNDCSLRGAIIKANGDAAGDTINVPAGTYTVNITNPAGTHEDAAATGDLDIIQGMTITGAGAATTIIDATGLVDRGHDRRRRLAWRRFVRRATIAAALAGAPQNERSLARSAAS